MGVDISEHRVINTQVEEKTATHKRRYAMARRKNTAECREVLRKVFENESTGHGKDSGGRNPGQRGRITSAGDDSRRNSGAYVRKVEPLLGKSQGENSDSFDRHDAIRSSAPGASLGDRGRVRPGSIEHPGGNRFASNVSDYVEEPVAAGHETLERDPPGASFSVEGTEGAQDLSSGAGDDDRMEARGSDVEMDPGDLDGRKYKGAEEEGSREDILPGDDPLQAPTGEDPAPDESRERWISRCWGWLLGDDSSGLLGKPLQVRASTLVLIGLSVAIVVGLLGLYFKIEPEEGKLAGRILDERESRSSGVSDESLSSPVKEIAAVVGDKSAVRTSANISSRGLAGLARPLWNRNGGHRPAVRNVEAGASSPAAGFVTTSATRWLRVRDLMGKKECARLLDHLKRLQKELRERNGCKDDSVACKELKSRMKERHEENLYAVDIGPFASWKLAQEASAELKKMTRGAPWVFNGQQGYFAESYPRKP